MRLLRILFLFLLMAWLIDVAMYVRHNTMDSQTVVTSNGGAVLTSVRVLPVVPPTWKHNDTEEFLKTVFQSSYFDPLAEYGVNRPTLMPATTPDQLPMKLDSDVLPILFDMDYPFRVPLGTMACGFHDYKNGPFVAVSNKAGCNWTEAVTHELVEALTDPIPGTGYIVGHDEIADVCQRFHPTLSGWHVASYMVNGECT